MALTSGSKLGPYEILAPIGAGGMGEVYRARDAALGRDVAVKVLPSDFSKDTDRLRRFKQEAQAAAALNHPNILTIYHVGDEGGTPYIVSELLEGETLRQRLQLGALPLRKTIDCGTQVARGLGAAHDKGIVHRDLKPENIFLCRDGRTKILDFGLAKLTRPEESGSRSDALTMTAASEPGFVVGTAGYMSPEQVRGQVAAPTSDLFAFGAILYEMLTGKRAFRGETAADTMSSILKEDPLQISDGKQPIPAAAERIVRHCLEKNPEERFQSARDVAFDLEALSSTSGSTPVLASTGASRKPRWLALAGVGLGIAAAFAGGLMFARIRGARPQATYKRLTFRQGTIQNARFTLDGNSVVYSAAWEGGAPELFTTRPGSPESRSLGLTGSTLSALSRTGEIAALMGAHWIAVSSNAGTLARLPLEGGAPREVLSHVENADWAPDGSTLLITHQVNGVDRLEFPLGKVIYGYPGVIGHPRLSPRGDLIAFFEHSDRTTDDGSVAFVTLDGKRTVLSTGWADLTGLAWSPGGDEIWFTGDRKNSALGLFAVTLAGREREVEHIPGDLLLFDVTRDGRVLMGREDWRGGMYGLGPGQTQERDLSLFDFSITSDLTRDGKLVLFFELGEMGGAVSPSFLRSIDGGPAVRLSDSPCAALTHDAQRMICTTPDGQLTEVPTKTGETRVLTHDKLQHGNAQWFSDEKRIVFLGQEPGSGQRLYVQDITGGEARAITPEGAGADFRLSPDETRVAVAMGADFRVAIYPVSGSGAPQTIPGLDAGEVPVAWSSDSRFLYCYGLGIVPARVFQIEVATGRRTEWKTLVPPDPVGVTLLGNILFSADMKSYAYSINRRLDTLYEVEGLR